MKSALRFPFILITIAMLITAIQPGCKKDKSPDVLLTAHSWIFSKMETTSTDSSIIKGIAIANAMMTGAVMTFHKDGTYTMTALQQTQTGTWELSADNKSLTITETGSTPGTMNIVKLTENDLVISQSDTDDNGNPYTTTLYWRLQ